MTGPSEIAVVELLAQTSPLPDMRLLVGAVVVAALITVLSRGLRTTRRVAPAAPLGFNRPSRDAVREGGAPAPVVAPLVTREAEDAPPAPVRIATMRATAPPGERVLPAKPAIVPPPLMSHDPITQAAAQSPDMPVGNKRPDNGDIYTWFGGQPPRSRR